jgi:hypothetical protein
VEEEINRPLSLTPIYWAPGLENNTAARRNTLPKQDSQCVELKKKSAKNLLILPIYQKRRIKSL